MAILRNPFCFFNEVVPAKGLIVFLLLCFFLSPQIAFTQNTPVFQNVIKVGDADINKAGSFLDAPDEGPNFESTLNKPSDTKTPSMLTQGAVIFLLSLLPYFVILLTAFIKVVVVLSLLRNALGVQQSPPSQVINGLAIILSIYVMYPTGLKMYEAGKSVIDRAPSELISPESSQFIVDLVDATKEPLKGFLVRNTDPGHIKSFHQLANKVLPKEQKGSIDKNDFLIIIPSYITSQLKDAYEIGVLIYLPFFIIDLVVSNILLAMGMMMLSPLTIALPLKLLLIVMIDGWTLIIQGLVLTFR